MSQMQTSYQSRPRSDHESSRSTLKDCTTNSIAKLDKCVSDYPVTALVVTLGAGLGIGMLLGSYIGGSVGVDQWRRQTAEGLGRRMMDAVSNVLPDSVSDRLSS